MSVIKEATGLSYQAIEKELELQLIEELKDENSSLNLYSFKRGESLSKEEILYLLRVFYITVKDNITESSLNIHIGWIWGIYESSMTHKDRFFSVDYETFINIAVKHFDLKLIEPCDAETFYGLTCEDFLLSHFKDKEKIDLVQEVQRARDSKDFKKIILHEMKSNLAYWKQDANGGGTGLAKDGYSSGYSGSLYVNDFEVHTCPFEVMEDYRGKKETEMTFNKSNYWEILYQYLLKGCGATLF